MNHTDGEGQNFTDCAPLGTYDQNEADEACAAYAAANQSSSIDCSFGGCGNSSLICAFTPENDDGVILQLCDYCWGYSGIQAGEVYPTFNGRGCTPSSTACPTPSASWQ